MSATTSGRLRAARTRTALAAGTLAGAALVGGIAAAAPASAASGDAWAQLRQCESGGDYAINTGNGFYGAYQFDAATWRGLGFSGLPHQASPATQDAAAAKLQAQRGWGPWPACSAKLGLRGTPAPAASTAAPAPAAAAAVADRTSATASRSASRTSVGSFSTAMVGQVSEEVRAWQREMTALGYPLVADGRYGAQSAAAARAFQAAHGLAVDGVVGPKTTAAMASAAG